MNDQTAHFDFSKETRMEWTIGLFLCFVVLLLDFWSGFFPIRSSNDPWWHLKTGKVLAEYMGEHGFAFPPMDVFTLTGSQTPWVNHEWLADLALYGLYALGGLQLCIAVKSLIIAAVGLGIILTLRAAGCRLGWCAVGGLFTILAAQTTLYLRPPIVTYLFIVVFLYLLCHSFPRHPRRTTILLVVLEIVWINLHGGAILGVILCGFFLAERIWGWLAGRWGIGTGDVPDIKVPLCCFVFVSLASLANPWGYEIYLLPGKVLGDPWLVSRLGELEAPNLRLAVGLKFLLCGFFLIPFLRGQRVGLFRGLTLLFFGYQALSHMRQIPLLALVAVPVLVERLDTSSRWLVERLYAARYAHIRQFGRFLGGMNAVILCCFLGYTLGWNPPWTAGLWRVNLRDLDDLVERGYIPDRYPDGAVNFILYHKIPGPMMNNDNFAGYLIWRLSPEIMPVFTDSRFDLFGSRFAKEERAVIEVQTEPYAKWEWLSPTDTKLDWERIAKSGVDSDVTAWYQSGKPYWRWILEDKYKINMILVYLDDPIDPYLQSGDRGWRPIYNRRKEGYEIYLADRPENQAIFERLGKKQRN
ncbi:MAG: hypothetical protein ABIH23_11495 [bacterium]